MQGCRSGGGPGSAGARRRRGDLCRCRWRSRRPDRNHRVAAKRLRRRRLYARAESHLGRERPTTDIRVKGSATMTEPSNETLPHSAPIDCVLVAAGKYHDIDFARLELLKLLAEDDNVRVRVFEDYSNLDAIRNATFLIT